MDFINILCEAEIYTISKAWEKWIPTVLENYGKKQIFQWYGFLHILCETLNLTISKICE